MPPSQLGRSRHLDDTRSSASNVATRDRLPTISASVTSKMKKSSTAQPYPADDEPLNPSLARSTQNAAASSATMEARDPDLPRIPWHDMDHRDLHSYRHAHRLTASSSQINPQAHHIFANAAQKGIYPPRVVAARRKQRELKKSRRHMAAGPKERSSSRLKGSGNGAANPSPVDIDESGTQTKEQLAMAVRKHFNAMSVSEGEVVARFTYVVRQIASSSDGDQDKGFRMRFKP